MRRHNVSPKIGGKSKYVAVDILFEAEAMNRHGWDIDDERACKGSLDHIDPRGYAARTEHKQLVQPFVPMGRDLPSVASAAALDRFDMDETGIRETLLLSI